MNDAAIAVALFALVGIPALFALVWALLSRLFD